MMESGPAAGRRPPTPGPRALLSGAVAGTVSDVTDGAVLVRRRHVIWGLYTTETPANRPVVAAFPLHQALLRLRRGHVSDVDAQVRGILEHRAPDNCQRTPRTPPRIDPRVPQPHQLHRQITPGEQRIQTPATPSIVKSRIPDRSARASKWAVDARAPNHRRTSTRSSRAHWECG